MAIPNETQFDVFSSVSSAGPFSFDWQISAKTDLRVFVCEPGHGPTLDDELAQNEFTFAAGATLSNGQFDGGSITLTTAVVVKDVYIVRDWVKSRSTAGGTGAVSLNQLVAQTDALVGMIQDLDAKVSRAVLVPPGVAAPWIDPEDKDGYTLIVSGSTFVLGSEIANTTVSDAMVSTVTAATPPMRTYVPNGVDDTTALNALITTMSAAGGGYITWTGEIKASAIVLKQNVSLWGTGKDSVIKQIADSNCTLVQTYGADFFMNWRLASAAVATDTSIVVNEVDTDQVAVGHTIQIMLDDGTFQALVITDITGTTISFAPDTLDDDVAAGRAVDNLTNPGPENCGIYNCYIDGNLDNYTLPIPDNVCEAQSAGGAGNLTLNGSLASGGSVTIPSDRANCYVYIYSAGDNSGITFTITGTYIDGAGASQSDSEVVTGPAAGKIVVSDEDFHTITQIAVSGATTGTVVVGLMDGPECADAVRFWAPLFRMQDVLIQNVKGCGVRSGWLVPANGWNSIYKGQENRIDNVDVYIANGDAFWCNGTGDGRISDFVANFMRGDGLFLDRRAAATKVYGGHISGAFASASDLREPKVAIKIDADTAELYHMTGEEGILANVMIRANNVVLRDGQFFHIDAIQTGDAHPNRIGIQIGDSTRGWQATKYRIETTTKTVPGGHVVFSSDGGGDIDVIGYDENTTISANEASGQTVLSVTDPTIFDVGGSAYITLNTGAVDSRTVTAKDATTITVSVAISAAADAGNKVYRGIAYTGTPLVTSDYSARRNIDIAACHLGQEAQFFPHGVNVKAGADYATRLWANSAGQIIERYRTNADAVLGAHVVASDGTHQWYDGTTLALQYNAEAFLPTGALIGSTQALSGAGAVSTSTRVTKWTTTGAGDAGTLADGVDGQEKVIVHVVDGGSGVLTPTNLANGTTITFTNVGEAAHLIFLGTEWHVVALYGAVLA